MPERTGPIRGLLQGLRNRRAFRRAQENPIAPIQGQEVKPGQVVSPGGVVANPVTQPVTARAGSVTETDGRVNAAAPDTRSVYDEALPELDAAAQAEQVRANAALGATDQAVAGRENLTEAGVQEGIARSSQTLADVTRTAAMGREDVQGLPDRVKADIQGIQDQYREQTNVDLDRIEGLGREAVGMAMEGKNAAAQAAVEAQQGAMRNAIAQINADPSIPPSRKTALISQIKTQSSMQIASTVGANIAQFTQIQTAAMTQTMQTVGAAMTARNQSLAAIGQAQVNAIAGAHETAATITKGYDDMTAGAYANADQIRFNYNNLAQGARDSNNTHDLALLDQDFYVGSMPYDFRMANLSVTTQALERDFALQLQAQGFETMQDAMQDSDWVARNQMLMAAGQNIGGPIGQLINWGMTALMGLQTPPSQQG